MELLKIGGNELDNAGFLAELAQTVAAIAGPLVIVHGGGRAIREMQARLGLPVVMAEGRRVTDAASMPVVQMVLSGQTNKVIVAALLAAGVPAVGISGVDGGLLRCQKKQAAADLGYVGEVVSVQPELICALLDRGMTPVISPVSLGLDGQIYNVNADDAAAAIAAALKVEVLNFVSNVPGVLDENSRLIATLTPAQTKGLIADSVIRDGMVPKVQAALDALSKGVDCARIVNLAGLAAGEGTRIFGQDLQDEQDSYEDNLFDCRRG